MRLSRKFKIGSASITALFFTIFLLELFLGGAGRLITFGPLTLRMYLYIGGLMLLALYMFLGKSITYSTAVLLGTFLALFVLAIVRGLFNTDDNLRLFADVKMISFFFILPFFDIMINDYSKLQKVVRLLKFATLFMAVAYLIFFVVLNLRLIPFLTIYSAMSKPEYFDEFGFRGETAMIYKGFIFMCIGYFFFFFEKWGRANGLKLLLIFLAIVLTLARAYILLIFGLTFFYLLYRFLVARKNRILNMFVISAVIVGAVILVPMALELLGDKSISDSIRFVQLQQVADMVNPISLFIGHGFGVGVPIRPGHMEIMYLEIFHKQGILGLIFWFAILGYIYLKAHNYRMYCKEKKIGNPIDTRPFLYGVTFLYLQSLFNPYLTNSMGMTFLFITLVIFEKLKKFNEQKNIGLHGNV